MRWIRRSRQERLDNQEQRSSEAGDTLIEVLLAITILGIAGVALLTGFVTSITASAQHRNLATQNNSLRVATNQVTSFLEQNSSAIFTCQTPFYAPWDPQSSLYSKWQASIGGTTNENFTISNSPTVQYWNGSTFTNTGTCTTTTPQQWTIGITSGGITTSVSTVVYNTDATTLPTGNCSNAPCHLVFIQVPATGVVNGNVSPQPSWR